MKNYDLNIWDELSYRTSGKRAGGWKVNAYELTAWGNAYAVGQLLDFELKLTRKNVVTLGFDPDVDEEMWIDAHSLVADYVVPRRMLRWLESLPQEEGK
jgi:hypothetical protein